MKRHGDLVWAVFIVANIAFIAVHVFIIIPETHARTKQLQEITRLLNEYTKRINEEDAR